MHVCLYVYEYPFILYYYIRASTARYFVFLFSCASASRLYYKKTIAPFIRHFLYFASSLDIDLEWGAGNMFFTPFDY